MQAETEAKKISAGVAFSIGCNKFFVENFLAKYSYLIDERNPSYIITITIIKKLNIVMSDNKLIFAILLVYKHKNISIEPVTNKNINPIKVECVRKKLLNIA